MKELGITKGEAESGFFDSNKHTYIRAQVKNEDSFLPTVIYEHRLTEDQCCHEECGCIKEELSNAKLIADTFNTANKCNLLPSELLQRYNEAIEVLKHCNDVFIEKEIPMSITLEREIDETISKAKP